MDATPQLPPAAPQHARWRRVGIECGVAALVAACVLLPLLGHRPLTAWDEGIYAEIAREMVHGSAPHRWLVPHWNGQPWFEKPPLAMWLMALSLRCLGSTALAARLPSALAGVATVALVYGWLRVRWNLRAAVLAALLLLGSFGFQHAARAGETDALLSFFCAVAVIGLAEVISGAAPGWLLFWVGMAFAMLVKGAAAITLPITCLCLAAARRHSLCRFPRSFAGGFAAFLVAVLPWHLYVAERYGYAFWAEYLGLHVVRRASMAIEGHQTQPWFYLWVLLVSAPVLLVLLPWAMASALDPPWGDAQERTRPLESQPCQLFPPAIFVLVTLILFSAARTRLPHYIAPVYPPAAAIAGVWLGHATRKWRLRWAALATVATCALAAVPTAPARRTLHSPHLPNGLLTPDNRASARLLATQIHLCPVPATLPLLVWRSDPNTPITTDAFYANRLVLPVAATASLTRASDANRYFPPPVALADSLPPGQERCLLLEAGRQQVLPPYLTLQPLAAAPGLMLAVVRRQQH